MNTPGPFLSGTGGVVLSTTTILDIFELMFDIPVGQGYSCFASMVFLWAAFSCEIIGERQIPQEQQQAATADYSRKSNRIFPL